MSVLPDSWHAFHDLREHSSAGPQPNALTRCRRGHRVQAWPLSGTAYICARCKGRALQHPRHRHDSDFVAQGQAAALAPTRSSLDHGGPLDRQADTPVCGGYHAGPWLGGRTHRTEKKGQKLCGGS